MNIQARAGITEVHFLPFNPVDKRTAITYIDSNGDWHRTSKGAPEQVEGFPSFCTISGISFAILQNLTVICLPDH